METPSLEVLWCMRVKKEEDGRVWAFAEFFLPSHTTYRSKGTEPITQMDFML
jgi:hypothetical protein